MAERTMTDALERLTENIHRAFEGRGEVVRSVVACLAARGHLLIEDLPGVGKTTLARALAASIACPFKRIQCTPDLLPTDITGVSVFEPSSSSFVFRKGPLFTSVLLADEINRTSPRTQSALLEAMNDGRVTIDGRTHELPAPFMVLATQNPHESEGVFPLPESQMDRFMMCLKIGYPRAEHERRILLSGKASHMAAALESVLTGDDVIALQEAVDGVGAADDLVDYCVSFARWIRDVGRGIVSPRAVKQWLHAARARAFLEQRDFVLPDDLKRLAVVCLAHRTRSEGEASGLDLVRSALDAVPVPI